MKEIPPDPTQYRLLHLQNIRPLCLAGGEGHGPFREKVFPHLCASAEMGCFPKRGKNWPQQKPLVEQCRCCLLYILLSSRSSMLRLFFLF